MGNLPYSEEFHLLIEKDLVSALHAVDAAIGKRGQISLRLAVLTGQAARWNDPLIWSRWVT